MKKSITDKPYVLRKDRNPNDKWMNCGKIIKIKGNDVYYRILKTNSGREGYIGEETSFGLGHSKTTIHKFLTEKEMLAWMI
ncbi:MAG: hypothetical protein IMZ52_02785 [Actinobacteria bacterium]|nr:hypothetical protein [Actinomycetota bacterium]MBE3114843.1 hypothetical protein [Actinomycetota bacterium]